ncbi:UTP--glucose-1-phosphate uridylyltransferase GalU [Pseudoteredinibacter isoporae]|uniref:UTP--glucose-1-phosphate uridylyltransferase n=1 Tax=Pseudoteredinibacter isoporae TaxID=570281 RepID=A0A7X0JT93_9GAMM|nr:UTP--glucose-1-phosphate uridylyltransferase GalU [Pseudoteredinibacter isoporae]MBB6520976.1 UTP--glucose-1-phosphate uridylyltransferase [Pseudoteredinibacter isoporae]NHO86541.1 UTP--glucose-1-phosphate uridylyltransferase GalU [Pseudoteredinibacter isoporae]NIB25007.1 UTP--glucose-1-phosphate uridylyltransferase GalU [Pseudoteredinibacter isoporae]
MTSSNSSHSSSSSQPKPLRKAIIPVAGLGTRVLPASKAIPKEMLPVVDKPVIQHVVEEAAAAGFTEIILVSRSGKSAIEDHFDVHYELESELSRKNKQDLLESVQHTLPAGVNISTVRQAKALGLGHAVLCAAPLVANEDFAVILPDMLIPDISGQASDLSQMVAAYRQHGCGQIMVEAVPEDKVERYGIVDCADQSPAPGSCANIVDMVEKPKPADAPSNLSINGRYILPARVMELLTQTKAGAGGEIQLTDAMANLIEEGGQLMAYTMQSKSYDCGNKAGYLEANLVYGLAHPETKDSLRALVKDLI